MISTSVSFKYNTRKYQNQRTVQDLFLNYQFPNSLLFNINRVYDVML